MTSGYGMEWRVCMCVCVCVCIEQLLPRRSGYEFDLHVYNKVSESPVMPSYVHVCVCVCV